MRMKKLFILAVAAIALVACSRTFEHETEGTGIGFGVWAEQMTKAARDQGSSYFTGGGKQDNHFWVYGYKTIGGDDKGVFKSQEVTTTNGVDWTYTPKKFWDPGATSYTFFALSRVEATDPTLDANKTASVTDGSFGSDDITFAGNDQDILVAKKVVVSKGDNNFNSWHTVDLDFHHIASIADFKVKKSKNLANSTVEVTAVSLINVKNNGKYSVAYSGTDPIATWADAASSTTGTYTHESGVGEVTLPDNVPAYNVGSADLIKSLIVRPHELADTELLQISYKITTPLDNSNNEVITVTNSQIKLNKFDKTDYLPDGAQTDAAQNVAPFIASWEQGKHYIYYITIDVHTIEFTAAITDWEETVSGYRYLLN